MSDKLNLDEIEARAKAAAALAEQATAGPWHPRATDDEHFMNARFVGSRIGPTRREWKFADGVTRVVESADGFMHDNKRGLAEGDVDQVPSDDVIAITLLQQPRLADIAECDQNTKFIAAARTDVPALAADVLALLADNKRLAMQLEAAQDALRDAIASSTANGEERDQLRAVAKATRETLTVIDEWLGMASTREAAIDSMRRLERMLSAVGLEYTWKGILDWRGSLIDELWQARFYAGRDGHWHYAPGDPPPVFGNAEGPELAQIVGRMEQAEAQLETARGLLMDCWHQLDGDVYVLPGGEVHPGAVTTIHALHAFLWPEGKTI